MTDLHPLLKASQEWARTHRPAIRARLQGHLTELATLGKIRSTDLMACLLRFRPLPPKVARRISRAYARLRLPGRLDWIELVDPVRATNPLFAPLTSYASALDLDRDIQADKEVTDART